MPTLTDEQIDALIAGPRTDALVAELVMEGGYRHAAGGVLRPQYRPKGKRRESDRQDLPRFSRDIAHAFEALDKITASGPIMATITFATNLAVCMIGVSKTDYIQGEAPTPALAASRAALKWAARKESK